MGRITDKPLRQRGHRSIAFVHILLTFVGGLFIAVVSHDACIMSETSVHNAPTAIHGMKIDNRNQSALKPKESFECK
jgi:hypothetical protein